MTNKLKTAIERLDKKLESIYDNVRHLKTASNCVFSSSIRENIDINEFLDDVEDQTAFDFESFASADKGSFLDFLQPKYRPLAQPLIDITAGGNGGMASIGRGEFAISFLSNFKSTISKSGCGDLENNGKFEEVKHNGGKLSIDDKAGNEIHRSFINLIKEHNIKIKKKDYLPIRKTDAKLYATTEKQILNGIYWQAMTGEDALPMTDTAWRLNSLKRSFNRLFEKADSLLVMDIDNKFVRFNNSASALEFYSLNLNVIDFELRNNHNNAPSFYLGREEVKSAFVENNYAKLFV